MPPVSERQRRFMWANHPSIMRRWAAEGKSTVQKPNKSKKAAMTAFAKRRRK